LKASYHVPRLRDAAISWQHDPDFLSAPHLGHVFPDPESPSGVRYTLNSACFHFIPVEKMKEEHYEAYLPLLEKK